MLQDELKEIRTQLRMAMNGVIATSMREKGIDYKAELWCPSARNKADSRPARTRFGAGSRFVERGYPRV